MAVVERPDEGIMVVDGLLTGVDEARLVGVLDTVEVRPQELGRSSRVRTRRRGESRSALVPELLWGRIGPLLPAPAAWFPAGPTRTRPSLEPDVRHWRWSGCSPLTRLYEYGPGDEFRPHVDEPWRAGPQRRSLLTVLVYLPTGEPCRGGETVVEGRAIAPLPGRVVVFDHRLVHAGQPVEAGRKLVLRNDVVAEADRKAAAGS
jgi:hypothetical protein